MAFEVFTNAGLVEYFSQFVGKCRFNEPIFGSAVFGRSRKLIKGQALK